MKRLSVLILVTMLLFAFSIGTAWSVISLPTASFTGTTDTTANSLDVSGFITQVNYDDGTSATSGDPVIGALVTIQSTTRTGPLAFQDTTITISDGTGAINYMTATLTDVLFVDNGSTHDLNPGLNALNPGTLNMRQIVLNSYGSRFIDELQAKLGTFNIAGMKMNVLGSVDGVNTGLNTQGLIDGVSDAAGGVGGVRSVGYWKNHIQEKNFFNYFVFDDMIQNEMIDMSTIFADIIDLDTFLTLKGKKSMEEKAKQQLAAVLLNIASSLDPSTVLTTGEQEILDLFGSGSTIGDAQLAIELAIFNGTNLEDAKDLADEINNRKHNE